MSGGAGRCVVTDLVVEQCAHCRAVTARQNRALFEDPTSPHGEAFPASYPGRCVHGDDDIEEGDLIVRTSDGYSHEDCVG